MKKRTKKLLLPALLLMRVAHAAPCPDKLPDPKYVSLGAYLIAVPMHPFSAGDDLVAGVAPPADAKEFGCKDHPVRADIYGLPLDNLVPETVYPEFSSPRGDPAGLRSGSQTYLFALPMSVVVAGRILFWADLGHLGVRGIKPQSQTPPEIRHVVYGPYQHDSWSGHFIVQRGRYKFPDGRAFTFTCTPGTKWGSCAVSYILRPNLGLAYTVWRGTAPDTLHPTQSSAEIITKMIVTDEKIRALALGLITSSH